MIENEVAQIAAALGQVVRLRIIRELCESSMVVETLALRVRERASVVSHHLGVLHQCRLVSFKKEGRYRIYSVEALRVAEFVKALKGIFTEFIWVYLN